LVNGSAGARQRLFVAVPLPGGLVDFVRTAQEGLPLLPGIRLMKPEQLHVTLAFMGEVGAAEAAAAREVVETVPKGMGGEVLLGGYLFFPSARKARVIALSISDSAGIFSALYERVMRGLETAGVMQREKRPFRAHLTVARLRLPGHVQPKSESGQAPFAVESVCLYESRLKREGAEYAVRARAAFLRADAREKG